MPRNRVIALVLTLVILAGGAIVVTFLSLRSRAVDTWIGKQIVGIVGGYLEPRIDFATLKYTAPYSVELHNVTLTARDGTKVTDVGHLTVELAEVPSTGRPIRIRKIVIDGAAVNLIESPTGGFKGLVPFVRAAPGKDSEKNVDENLRLSSVLRLDKVELRNCSLTYAPADGSPPMVLSGLTFDLNVAKVPRPEPGWYRIDTSFGRLPQLTVTAAGNFNLDTLVAELEKSNFQIDLNEITLQSLPPPIQSLLKQYDAQGRLTVAISGVLPLLKVADGNLQCSIALESFRFSSGDYTLPIDKGAASITLQSAEATLSDLTLNMLNGAIRANGKAHLGQPQRPADLAWQIDSLDLQSLLRAGTKPGEAPKLAGILNGTGTAATHLDDPKGSLSGDGKLDVKNGRLIILPFLQELARTMGLTSSLYDSTDLNHTADATFTLGPKGLTITESEVVTEFVAARVTGLVAFDKSLDLRAHAGPLEKLQSLLGQAGRAIAFVTDKAVTYRVRGVLGSPTVEVLPLGIE